MVAPAPEKVTYTQVDLAAIEISPSFSSSPQVGDEMGSFQPIDAADLARYNIGKGWVGDDHEEILSLGGVDDSDYWVPDGETYRYCMVVVDTLEARYECLRRDRKCHLLTDIYK